MTKFLILGGITITSDYLLESLATVKPKETEDLQKEVEGE